MTFVEESEPRGAFTDADYAHLLRLEENSFWFRARNDLIRYVVTSEFPRARNLLEVGCGNGYVLAGLKGTFPDLELHGSELSVDALRFARERVPQATLYQFDARAIPFRNEFDVVCAFDVLEHIEDDTAALAQMNAATNEAGGLLITVPQHPWLWSAPDDYSGHQRRYTRAELITKLHSVGLEAVRMTSFATAVLPLMAISRLRSRLARGSYEPTAEHLQAQRMGPILDRLMQVDLGLIRRGHSLRAGGSLLVTAIPRSQV